MTGEFVCWKCEKSFPIKVMVKSFPWHPIDNQRGAICNDCFMGVMTSNLCAQFGTTSSTYQDNGVTE